MSSQLSAILQAQWASLSDPWQATALAAGLAGALLVVISAFVKTMIPLRWLAVGSNLGFIVYGLMLPSPMVALLHVVLLPVNLWRVNDMLRLTRRARAAATDARQLSIWLKPYMRPRRRRAGQAIFRRGDPANRLYYLVEGEVELPEVGRTLRPGEMFGEIAFFAPDRRRSSSALCRTDCTVMSIDEDTFRQLCLQNPDFGFHVVSLIASRLSGDLQRLRREGASPTG
jgi:CRP/FNR family cyclic AMP-dependent transcriptional regulator